MSRFKEKKTITTKTKHVQNNHGQKVRIALLMNCVKAAMFLGSADTTMDEVLHPGRQGSSRLGLFWGNFFFLFGGSPSFRCAMCLLRRSVIAPLPPKLLTLLLCGS